LTFSPPDADLEIQGRRIGDGYLIAITDQGIGMSRADLERANERLRGEGDFVAAPTRFLGHYVVGRLATALDVDVQLAPSPVTGVTARIILPPAVLATEPALPEATASAPVLPPRERSPLRVAAAPVTQVLTLEPGVVPAVADDRIRPDTIEYVTVPERPPPPIAADGEHTPNGLRRRTRRRPVRTVAPARPAGPAVPVGDSPDEIRDRLTAFRTGTRLGAERT
jgi:hypothetical protein